MQHMLLRHLTVYSSLIESSNLKCPGQAIEGVTKITDKCNPATWMLEISFRAAEECLEIDFAEIYKKSPLFQ